MPEARRQWRDGTREAARIASQPEASERAIEGALDDAARDVRDAIKASYRRAPGPPLSEVQRARKRGTEGAGRKLIGHRGERLIDHVEAHNEGRKVDD